MYGGFFTILGQKFQMNLFIPANQPYPIAPQGLSPEYMLPVFQ